MHKFRGKRWPFGDGVRGENTGVGRDLSNQETQQTMMFMKRWLRATIAVGLIGMLAVAMGCGDEPEQGAKLNVQVIGWGPGEDGSVGFQPRLPVFDDNAQVRASLTQPNAGSLLESKTSHFADRGAKLPELRFGEGFRLEVELLANNGQPLAVGATPLFDFQEGGTTQGFRIQVDAIDSFSPVGAVFQRSGRSQLDQSRFDYRAARALAGDDEDRWLGRVGHAAVTYEDGNKLLIVGGAHVDPMFSPGSMPQIQQGHDDLMEFDPVSGYFSDLSYDDRNGAPLPNGADRLLSARAFHTVTPIGEDRFLVVGGLAPNDPQPRALNSIELIDMRAEIGTRVQQLTDGGGDTARLNDARAFHTATYRPADNSVVVAGGVGRGGPDDALDTIEIIDLDTGQVHSGPTLRAARAEHEAVLMADSSTIWLLGGRDGSGALASTEVLALSEGTNVLSEESDLNTARFGFSALRVSPNDGKVVVVVGGYSGLDGSVTDTFEMSTLGRGQFESAGSWRLEQARGGLVALELPASNNLVVFGGRDGGFNRVEDAEILDFTSLGEARPYHPRTLADRTFNRRSEATATLLSNGKIVLVGGVGRFDDRTTTLDNAEYFTSGDTLIAPRQAQ
jgi:hypothetical protein